ncbi:MAG: SGNH/GDSL hydrolase family protein, partial [Clostridia bacterium]|nr:SGNH/GDSL hydrolase family protein [Clostridia bacterium]
GDTDRGTYCGAVRWLMNKLTEMYPNAKIVFMTPARRLGDEKPSQSLHRYYPSLLLRDYVDVIIETAKDFDIHVLDLYTQLGIDPNGEEDRVKYTAEGLHFNDAGHRVIAQRLKEYLESL